MTRASANAVFGVYGSRYPLTGKRDEASFRKRAAMSAQLFPYLLKSSAVQAAIARGCSWIYSEIRQVRFPSPWKLGPRPCGTPPRSRCGKPPCERGAVGGGPVMPLHEKADPGWYRRAAQATSYSYPIKIARVLAKMAIVRAALCGCLGFENAHRLIGWLGLSHD